MGKRYKDEQENSKGQTFRVRMNQLFGPYGVGSIMPCPGGESLMISGLDAFPTRTMKQIRDPRLATHIGVRKLLEPPEKESIPASRFPRWLYCPTCKTMFECKPNQPNAGKCHNPACRDCGKRDLIPERFIVVCPEGHVDDLPIIEWVHRGAVSDNREHIIKRTTKGGTANLADIEYKCITCGIARSLAGITNKGALAENGYRCKGSQPWLWRDDPDGCAADPHEIMVVQRGGTNVWYPDVFSSIFIPDGIDQRVVECVEKQFEALEQAEQKDMLDMAIKMIAGAAGLSIDGLMSVYSNMKKGGDGLRSTDGDFKQEEFITLSSGSNQQKGVFEVDILASDEYKNELVHQIVESISLVTTLRETRALVGFSRLLPDHNDGLSFSKRRSQLSRKRLDWTLGIQSIGEGVFIKFRKECLEAWARGSAVASRFSIMQRHHDEHCVRHGKPREVLNPLYVAIHTLAHLLMLSLSKECGYSTASIRERIYCDKLIIEEDRHEDMLGVLIYTASSDSEGSLGGIVRAGRPGRFEDIFEKAIESARWCSSDPVCIESRGQGPESCNLAACYSCALVPETSCENGNRLLDRGLIVGTVSGKNLGLVDCGYAIRDVSDSSDAREMEVHYAPALDAGYDMSEEGFTAACCRAIADAETDDERLFLEKLIDIGTAIELETPLYYVPFISAEGEQIDATLAWRCSRVALFVGEAAKEFVDVVGESFCRTGEWMLYAAIDLSDPHDFASKLAGEF